MAQLSREELELLNQLLAENDARVQNINIKFDEQRQKVKDLIAQHRDLSDRLMLIRQTTIDIGEGFGKQRNNIQKITDYIKELNKALKEEKQGWGGIGNILQKQIVSTLEKMSNVSYKINQRVDEYTRGVLEHKDIQSEISKLKEHALAIDSQRSQIISDAGVDRDEVIANLEKQTKLNERIDVLKDKIARNERLIAEREADAANAGLAGDLAEQAKQTQLRDEYTRRLSNQTDELTRKEERRNELVASEAGKAALLVDAMDKAEYQTQEMINGFVELNKKNRELNKNLGYLPNIAKGISDGFKKIGLGKLSDFLDIDGAVAKTKQLAAARKAKGETKFMGGTRDFVGEMFKGAGKSLAALGGISLAIQGLYKVVKFFIEAMFEADKQIVSLGRNLAVSRETAAAIRESFIVTKGTLESQYQLTKEMLNAQAELGQLSAYNALYSNEVLDAQIQLTKEYKIAADEASALQRTLIVNNEAGKDGVKLINEAVVEYNNQNKALFNTTKVLSGISKISGQIRAVFAGNTQELVKSYLRAEQLGLTLEKARAIANSLLDFNSSIEAELEAELLLGKDLNLERARGLALQNDYAGVAEEVAKQGMNYYKWSKLNYIQQESFAKVLGMNVDDVSDMLEKEQFLSQQVKNTIADYRERARILRTQGDIAAATRLEEIADKIYAGKLDAKSVEESLKQLNAQEKFTLQLDRAKEIFSDLVEGGILHDLADILEKITNGLVDLFGRTARASRTRQEFETAKAEGVQGEDLTKKYNVAVQARANELGPSKARQGVFKGIAKGVDFLTGAPLFTDGPGIFEKMINDYYDKEKSKALAQSQSELQLASGGVVTKPVKALVGEKAQEAVLPLDDFYQTLDNQNNTLRQEIRAQNTQPAPKPAISLEQLQQMFNELIMATKQGNNVDLVVDGERMGKALIRKDFSTNQSLNVNLLQ